MLLEAFFDIDVENSNVCEVIDNYITRAWRGHRAKSHVYFKGIGGPKDLTKAKTTHPLMLGKKIENICVICGETSKKIVMASVKRKVDSRNGSQSTIRYHIERDLDFNFSSDQLEAWWLTHWVAEKVLILKKRLQYMKI